MRKDFAIDYVELPGTEMPAMKGFYGRAFGWSFTDYGPDYAAFQGAGVDGGIDTDASKLKGPLVVLFARDLEGAVGAVEEAGGEITIPIFSFPGGRRFHFRDPAGNELAVWSDTGVTHA
jgi:hypothetical protein